jgi:predicted ATP-dependent serine protease
MVLPVSVLKRLFAFRVPQLSFGLENIDELFPGFVSGDFAVLYGLPTCLYLSFLLSVRCQLSRKRGGLDSSVIFIDGGNSFDVYTTSSIAQQYGLDPKQVLEKIYISRAFTAYQLTSLILEKLKEAFSSFKSKLVIVSDIISLYLDRDVPKTEAVDVFHKLTNYLSKFARENKVIVVATHFLRFRSVRSMFFESVLFGRADVLIRVKDSRGVLRFVLEKHPRYGLGEVEFPFDRVTLERFMEV